MKDTLTDNSQLPASATIIRDWTDCATDEYDDGHYYRLVHYKNHGISLEAWPIDGSAEIDDHEVLQVCESAFDSPNELRAFADHLSEQLKVPSLWILHGISTVPARISRRGESLTTHIIRKESAA